MSGISRIIFRLFHYFNPIRAEVVLDRKALCEDILSERVTRAELMAAEEHYCSHGCAGMFFRFLPLIAGNVRTWRKNALPCRYGIGQTPSSNGGEKLI